MAVNHAYVGVVDVSFEKCRESELKGVSGLDRWIVEFAAVILGPNPV